MRDYAKISPTIWRSRKFKALGEHEDARLFYLYLHTCPHGNSVGCFWLPKGYINADLNWSDTRIDTCIKALCKQVLIRWNEAENVVQIVDFLGHSPIHNDKHAAGSIRLALSLPDCDVKISIINELKANKRCKDNDELKNYETPMDTPMDTGIPTETETEVEEEPPLVPQGDNLEIPECCDRSEEAEAVKLWNRVADEFQLAIVQKLTATRRRSLKRRLKDCGGLEGWKVALAKVAASPGLCGNNDRKWRADFDFMMQEKSFVKLMEGGYDQWGSEQVDGDDQLSRAEQADLLESKMAERGLA